MDDITNRIILEKKLRTSEKRYKKMYAEVSIAREHLQQLSKQMTSIQEDERHRISRQFHDEIGGLLTALKLTLNKKDLDEYGGTEIIQARELLEMLIKQSRDIAFQLRSTALDDHDLLEALFALVSHFNGLADIEINLKAEILTEKRFDPDVETAVYRVIQEALSNIVRHANASSVHIHVDTDEEVFRISITDNGVGFDTELQRTLHESLGLSGMRERTVLSGGELLVTSNPGEGTRIEAVIAITKGIVPTNHFCSLTEKSKRTCQAS